MSDLVVIDSSVLLAIALPDPQANKDYVMALLFAIDKGDVTPVLTHLCHHEVASKLVRKVRGQAITAVKAHQFFDLLADISFRHVVDIRDAQTLYLDAMALGCGSYDGAYVRAALDNGAQLATLVIGVRFQLIRLPSLRPQRGNLLVPLRSAHETWACLSCARAALVVFFSQFCVGQRLVWL